MKPTKQNFELGKTDQISTRQKALDVLLAIFLEEDVIVWFVSDIATIYDVAHHSTNELQDGIRQHYGIEVTRADLKLPLWKLLDKITESQNGKPE